MTNDSCQWPVVGEAVASSQLLVVSKGNRRSFDSVAAATSLGKQTAMGDILGRRPGRRVSAGQVRAEVVMRLVIAFRKEAGTLPNFSSERRSFKAQTLFQRVLPSDRKSVV